jgi:hypothetical protein
MKYNVIPLGLEGFNYHMWLNYNTWFNISLIIRARGSLVNLLLSCHAASVITLYFYLFLNNIKIWFYSTITDDTALYAAIKVRTRYGWHWFTILWHFTLHLLRFLTRCLWFPLRQHVIRTLILIIIYTKTTTQR